VQQLAEPFGIVPPVGLDQEVRLGTWIWRRQQPMRHGGARSRVTPQVALSPDLQRSELKDACERPL
jgi:hypothetical protein